jgi:hypothetical protein
MAKRYSERTVRYRVRRGKDGVERGHWEALLRVSDGGGPWKSRSKAIKDYLKQTADGRTVRAEILSPPSHARTRVARARSPRSPSGAAI